ncbi:MAG: ABC transporter ATP-binding protein [Sporocytophaga sp.]|uniref:ABC transporter ATP-binding protein n=1 Tax=Sporocytophaga sp. TaxID=2231183 RepID=UPI001B248F05|nr:ABC transporter ATP-binding protein [Sporocytophaga sp.]MBO9700283.1 ABC transporter ATP-binding protein [Sporocytophaga sp.]
MVQVNNLFKTYKKGFAPALSGVNLTIQKGDFFGLLGPNGAGKTTLISIICGLSPANIGTAYMNETDILRYPEKIKKYYGLVPQDIALYPSLTAEENLRFFGRMYGIPGNTIKSEVDFWLPKMGLSNHRHKKINEYSTGMKRRVNLIAGILHKPSIIILDEPTVGVDVQSRVLILETLKEINSKGTTVIYTSHYLEEAEDLCNRIAIIDKGRIIKEGEPAQLIAQENPCSNLEDLFIKLTGKELRD